MSRPTYILGLHKDPWHNSGAAMIRHTGTKTDFVNLSEERCNREKDSRAFPSLSIAACLDYFGLASIEDVDRIVLDYIADSDWRKDEFKTPCMIGTELERVDEARISVMNHHLAHAYSVFFSSPFEEAAILIIDGRGSERETQSLFYGSGKSVRLIASTDFAGIGLLYSSVTQAIGFKLLQEGKTMGLAPYGAEVDKKIFGFPRNFDGIVTDYRSAMVEGTYDLTLTHPPLDDFDSQARAAWEIQNECEEAMLHLAAYAKEKTCAAHLCISGGVGLNSVSNYKILMANIFEDIYINPGASDTGIPIGAALYGLHELCGADRTYGSVSPYLGPLYGPEEIEKMVSSFDGYTVYRDNAFEHAVRLLKENGILGCFQGRSEMGPRALGNRSILMSALRAENKDILNARVKLRESFRPFAPSCLQERASDYFVIDRPSPYMLLVPKVREEKRSVIPAVTHADGTGRLQTVTEESNLQLYRLIEEFERATGVPVILNTSFNVAGKPIVESPEDAIRCFLSTNIDGLLIEDYFLVKD